MFHLEPVRLRTWEELTKRSVDVVLATAGLAVAGPLLVLIALAIRVHDGGPALFRQVRVGRDGRPFTLLKLRSMVMNAEDLGANLEVQNQRDCVLFKIDDDPRVTTIGRFIRATSIDELPQLLNVLRGEMSLVGPRPALPREVAQFDEPLLSRHLVRPGLTGLWQVEARDTGGLGAYTRLDLFYVENWSVLFDFAIMMSTVTAVVARGFRVLTNRRWPGIPAEDPATALDEVQYALALELREAM